MLKCDFNKVALQFPFLTCSEYSQKTSLLSPIIFFCEQIDHVFIQKQPPEMFCKKWCSYNIHGKTHAAPVFCCEYCKIFKNTYFEEHLRTTATFCEKKFWSSLVLHHISNFLFEKLLVGNQCFNHVETSHLTETANQLTGFYIKRYLVLSGLIREKLNQNGRF